MAVKTVRVIRHACAFCLLPPAFKSGGISTHSGYVGVGVSYLWNMAPHLEIERKFLVKCLPPGWKYRSHSKIDQGYLPRCEKDTSIRLRKQDAKHFLTIKAGTGQKRTEEEIKLGKHSFEALWPLTRGARIAKTRYKIPHNDVVIELDIFQGQHRGLAIAEIEFDSERVSRSFRPLPWFGPEVTRDRRFTNEVLARSPRRKG